MNWNSNSQIPVIDQDAINLFDVPNQTGTPERNLLMAVLERAILDFVGNTERDVQAAEDWIFDDDDNDGDATTLPCPIFSFRWVCQQLDLDPARVMQTVQAMPKRGSNRTAPWYFMKAS